MKKVERKNVDCVKTGNRLMALRTSNLALRRYVCWSLRYDLGECSVECASCEFEMDRSISRTELADVLSTTENVVFNWESGKTPVPLEDLLLYTGISSVPLEDIVVLEETN